MLPSFLGSSGRMPPNSTGARCWSSAQICFQLSAWRVGISPDRDGRSIKASGTVCGIKLPSGLKDGSRLPEPIFTPATKSQDGAHDENISYASVEKLLGANEAAELRELTLAIYRTAAAHAESCGLILADTKFEFGKTAEGVILADEVLTPDSSRFWDGELWKPGGAQPSFDKQFVRDYLEEINWNKQAPAPNLPDEVVERTRAKYLEAFRRLTGRGLET